jgi:hypothetical protein
MSSQTDIIIKGGSVELTYDDTVFKKDVTTDPNLLKASDYKITQVVVTGGGMDWASEVFPQGSDCTIRIVCKS